MAERRASGIAVAALLGVVAVLGCVVALGAAAGPGTVLAGGHRVEHRAPTAVPSTPAEDEHHKKEARPRRHEPPAWLGWVTLTLVAGAAVLVVGGLLLLRPRRSRRRADGIESSAGQIAEPPDPATVTAYVRFAVDEIAAVLERGEPRNAVVACWQRLERLLAEVGVPRQPWETSTEFTTRALTEVSADPDGVRRLAARYREARFSDHPIGEGQRAEARAALAAVQASLRVPGARSGR